MGLGEDNGRETSGACSAFGDGTATHIKPESNARSCPAEDMKEQAGKIAQKVIDAAAIRNSSATGDTNLKCTINYKNQFQPLQ